MEALEALRQLFFMGAGDWGSALVAGLCAAAASRGSVAASDLQLVLEESLKVRQTSRQTFTRCPATRLPHVLSFASYMQHKHKWHASHLPHTDAVKGELRVIAPSSPAHPLSLLHP